VCEERGKSLSSVFYICVHVTHFHSIASRIAHFLRMLRGFWFHGLVFWDVGIRSFLRYQLGVFVLDIF